MDWFRDQRPAPASRWIGSQGPLELLLRVVRAYEETGFCEGALGEAAIELRRQGFLGATSSRVTG